MYKPLPNPETLGPLPKYNDEPIEIIHTRLSPDTFDLRKYDNQHILIHIYHEIERIHDRIDALYNFLEIQPMELQPKIKERSYPYNYQYYK